MKPTTALSLLRDITSDGFLSETNAARAQELLRAAESAVVDVPGGEWRDQVVGMRFVEGAGLRPSVRNNPETVYLASDVHKVLAQILNR